MNDLDEAVWFHFIKQPEVQSEIRKSWDIISLTIKEFRSQYRKDEEGQILENFETLSAVFIDRNFDGRQFIMTDSFFADELLPKKKTKNRLKKRMNHKKILDMSLKRLAKRFANKP